MIRKYAEHGGSKSRRLRCFLQKCDDPMAIRTLNSLWEHRCEHLARTGQNEPVLNAEARFRAQIHRLGGESQASPAKRVRSPPTVARAKTAKIKTDLVQVSSLSPQARGYGCADINIWDRTIPQRWFLDGRTAT